MGRSAKAHEILELLAALARGTDAIADRALRGLRWFDHPEGWQLIRRRAADPQSPLRHTAVELLGFNDDPASRDLLLRLLADCDASSLQESALESARRLWGRDSLEPDYALVRNEGIHPYILDELLERLQQRGDARRMLEVLPHLSADIAARLKGILLSRQPLPVAEAQTVAAGPDAAAAGVAAHLLGRAGAAAAAGVVAAALRRWWGEWDKGRQEEARRGAVPGKLVEHLLEPLRSLAWSAGRLGGGSDTLIAMATTRADVPFDRQIRRAAVAALAASQPSPPLLAALEALAGGDDPEIRATAAQAVAWQDASRAGEVAKRILSDRVAFNRVAGRAGVDLTEAVRGAAAQVHYQGVAVPYLAARGDVPDLTAAAGNRGLSEETRLGAVEGLGAAGSEASEAELQRIGLALENSEELRKAAWRALRRSRRARQRTL